MSFQKIIFPSEVSEIAFFDSPDIDNAGLVHMIGSRPGVHYPEPTSKGPIRAMTFRSDSPLEAQKL